MKLILFLALYFLFVLTSFVSAYDCVDSDNGLNSITQGTVTFNGQDKYKDSCASGGEISRVNNLEASKGDVLEFSCYSESGTEICSSGACLYSVLKCSDGQTCNNGKCSLVAEDNSFNLPAGLSCEDSDEGIKFDIKGLVKYRVGDDSVNKAEDYCVTDKELREYYCDDTKEKPMQLSVTQCEGVCACGRCFNKGEDVTCKADYQNYCNDESCFIPQKDFGEIKFISQTKLNEGCLVASDCKIYAGKYAFNSFPVQSRVELNANINFLELSKAIEKSFGKEPTVDDKSYSIDDGNNMHIFWISDKKIVSLEIPKSLIDSNKEDEDFGDFLREYQTVHSSDVQKNLNFFEKVIQWFKNLFG